MALLKKSFSLSWHLTFLVLAAMIPLLLFAAIMVSWLGNLERIERERRLFQASAELATSFDQDIAAAISTLKALAVFDALQQDQLADFNRQLAKVLATQVSWETILLHSPDGRLMLSALRSHGEQADPTLEPESIDEVLRTREAVIGRIVPGSSLSDFAGRYAFPIRVPVFREDRTVKAILSAVIAVDSLQKLALKFKNPSEEWTRTIVDPYGIIGARTREPEKYLGRPGTPSFIERISSEDRGLVREISLEGKPVYLSFARASLSRWVAAVAVPAEIVEAPAHDSMLIVIGVGLALLLVFGGLAFVYAHRLARDLKTAARGADVLARGEIPEVRTSAVQEIDALGKALIGAAELLHLREKERAEHLAEAQLARAEAEDANRAKSQFLANMSHELRTPLGVVLGFADLFASELVRPEEKIKSREIIHRSSKQLLRLIDDILDLSKVEANKLSIELINFSLPDLMSGLIEDFKVQAMEKGIKLNLSSNGAIPEMIRSDPIRLRQVIYNILGNALKFTERGTITLSVHASSSVLTFTVKDTGIGLSEQQQKNLFVAFSQADASHTRKFGGTGLGLALSRKIARLLGGDLQLLESQPGVGSTFCLTIDLTLGERTSFTDKFSAAKIAIRGNLVGARILLAEDSPDNVLLILRFLENEGAKIDVVSDGIEALEAAGRKSYDLILMDIQMPRMDGYEATRALRARGFTLPIIALTAHALSEYRDKVVAQGFTDYVTKPVVSAQLISVLLENLKIAQTQSKLAGSKD